MKHNEHPWVKGYSVTSLPLDCQDSTTVYQYPSILLDEERHCDSKGCFQRRQKSNPAKTWISAITIKARFKGGPVVTKSPLVTGSCPDSFLKHWQTTQLTWECKTPARHNGWYKKWQRMTQKPSGSGQPSYFRVNQHRHLFWRRRKHMFG